MEDNEAEALRSQLEYWQNRAALAEEHLQELLELGQPTRHPNPADRMQFSTDEHGRIQLHPEV